MDLLSFSGIFILGLSIGFLEIMCGVGYTLLLPLALLLLGYDPISIICATTATQVVFSLLHWIHAPKVPASNTIPIVNITAVVISSLTALAGALLIGGMQEDILKFLIILAALYSGTLLVVKERHPTLLTILGGLGVHSFVTGYTGIGIAPYGLRVSMITEFGRLVRKLVINSQMLTCGIVALVCVGYKPASSVSLLTALLLAAIAATALRHFFIVPDSRRYKSCMGVAVIIISLLTLIVFVLRCGER